MVRHVIVQRIIKAYEDDETEERRNAEMNTHDIYIDWEFPGTNPLQAPPDRVIAAALEAEGVRIPLPGWTCSSPTTRASGRSTGSSRRWTV